jgi:hypothetical protein
MKSTVTVVIVSEGRVSMTGVKLATQLNEIHAFVAALTDRRVSRDADERATPTSAPSLRKMTKPHLTHCSVQAKMTAITEKTM